jgi:hypothetical protein
MLTLAAISFAADDPFSGKWRAVSQGDAPHQLILTSFDGGISITAGPLIYTLKVDAETFDLSIRDKHEVTAKLDGKEFKSDDGFSIYKLRRIDNHTIEEFSGINAAQFPKLEGIALKSLWQVKGDRLIYTIHPVLPENEQLAESQRQPYVQHFERIK